MPSIAVHKERIKEHLQEIEDAIAIGIERRPATIGLHVSACAVSLIELYLRKIKKITAGQMIKHEWFARPKPGQKIAPLAERKLPAIFPKKREILESMYDIEEQRNKLIYGNPSPRITEATYRAFQKLYNTIQEQLGEEFE